MGRAFVVQGRRLNESLAVIGVDWRRLLLRLLAATTASQGSDLVCRVLVLILSVWLRWLRGRLNSLRLILLVLKQLLLQILDLFLLLL
jgi:hypothetical protein